MATTLDFLPNVENLSENEKRKILSVIKRDDVLNNAQQRKLGQIKQEISALKMKSVLRDGDDSTKLCVRCRSTFSLIFNRGELCPKCNFKVCKLCKVQMLNGQWVCTLCYKMLQVKLTTGDWMRGLHNRKSIKRWPSGSDLVKAAMTAGPAELSVRRKSDVVISRTDDMIADDEVIMRPNQQKSPPKSQSKHHNDSTGPLMKPQSKPHGCNHNGPPTKLQSRPHGKLQRQTSNDVKHPKESDQKRLDALVGSFREKHTEAEKVMVKKVTTKRYADSDSSSSEDSESVSNIKPIKTSSKRNSLEIDRVSSSDLTNLPDESNDNSSPRDNHARTDSRSTSVSYTESWRSSPEQSPGSSRRYSSESGESHPSTIPSPVKTRWESGFSRSNSSASERSVTFKEPPVVHKGDPRARMRNAIKETILENKMTKDESQLSDGGSKPRLLDIARTAHHRLDSSGSETLSSTARSSPGRGRSSGNETDYTIEESSQVKFKRLSTDTLHKVQLRRKISEIDPGPELANFTKTLSDDGGSHGDDSGHASSLSQETTPEQLFPPKTIISTHSSSFSTSEQEEEDDDIDELVLRTKIHGSRGNLLTVGSESKESLWSIYSNAGDGNIGTIPVTGDIQFGIDYNYKTSSLEVHITQCRNIAAVDNKRNRSDPYVKTYLLPDKTRTGKRKTKVKRHTLNPKFDEILRYPITKSELENRTLWVSVWNNDRFGRNDFLGEVTVPLDYYKYDDVSSKWYNLDSRADTLETVGLTYKGDIILSIRYVTADRISKNVPPVKKKGRKSTPSASRGRLQVAIKEAKNLTAVRSHGSSDPFCKGYLLPEKDKHSKQKTSVVKRDCNPVWNSTFMFDDISIEELVERSLELTVWDHDKLSSNDFLGGLRLNTGSGYYQGKAVEWMDAHGEEISLWQATLDRPNTWIDGSLPLRPSMDKRKY